jgi:hypothetical protein
VAIKQYGRIEIRFPTNYQLVIEETDCEILKPQLILHELRCVIDPSMGLITVQIRNAFLEIGEVVKVAVYGVAHPFQFIGSVFDVRSYDYESYLLEMRNLLQGPILQSYLERTEINTVRFEVKPNLIGFHYNRLNIIMQVRGETLKGGFYFNLNWPSN